MDCNTCYDGFFKLYYSTVKEIEISCIVDDFQVQQDFVIEKASVNINLHSNLYK